ncbi:hypothetical protein A3Q56_05439 [Intoshia linei]|uniref:Uncharacterized protein n=1 Tax=Intoshia linei TaxID=1819745 RepID=A0A177AZL2_9BILA|nr:hypothetical protein A3Q56_05439 [Intoshia linei]
MIKNPCKRSLSENNKERFRIMIISLTLFKPKYMRLIDNMYPKKIVNSEYTIIKSALEKLTMYSMQQPQKLNRISRYLLYKTISNLKCNDNFDVACVSIDAIDHLLNASSSSANLVVFVENYLQILREMISKDDDLLLKRVVQSLKAYSFIETELKADQSYQYFIFTFCIKMKNVSAQSTITCLEFEEYNTNYSMYNIQYAERLYNLAIGIEAIIHKVSPYYLVNKSNALESIVFALTSKIYEYETIKNIKLRNISRIRQLRSTNNSVQCSTENNQLKLLIKSISFSLTDDDKLLNTSSEDNLINKLEKCCNIFDYLAKKCSSINIELFLKYIEK